MLYFFLNLAGAVALLLWSVRLVRTGVERAFSVQLRHGLRRSAENRLLSVGTGLVASVLMQSATAVAVLTAGFVAAGTIETGIGLTILLGADIGSAVVTQILLVSPAWLIPALLLIGVMLFLRGRKRTIRQAGRILIGLALIFVALTMIRETTAPLQQNPQLAALLGYFEGDLLSAFVLGAGFAWAAHSSVAAVLLVVTLAAQGVLPALAAMALILGANLGGALIAVTLTLKSAPTARQMVIGNALLRGGGALAVLALLYGFPAGLDWLGSAPGRQAITLHLVFNIAIALVGLLIPALVLRAAGLMVRPPDAGAAQLQRVSALDPAALAKPDRALACATREVIWIGTEVEAMLTSVIRLYRTWDDAIATSIRDSEARVDEVYFKTKVYLAKLQGGAPDEEMAQRSMDLLTTSVNLEAAGDLIARNMLGLASNLQNQQLQFSALGWQDITDFYDRVLANAS